MSAYPVAYEQSPPVDRSRLSVFFRYFLLIPLAIVAYFYSIAAGVVTFLAWFAILFTGRYPAGLYDFVAGYVRFSARMGAFAVLLTDTYPPFSGGENPEYPIRVLIPEPQKSYSRLTTFFRGLLLIPVMVVLWVFEIWIVVFAIAMWFVAVITGRTGPGLTNGLLLPFTYCVRASAYMYLLTDGFPPLSND
jgi:hypothetical protein